MNALAPLRMNHVELFETTRNGTPTFRIICPDHTMTEFFDEWAYQLAKVKVNRPGFSRHSQGSLRNAF
ncbi:hypothetical protein, partial [Pseudomonas lundensis]|uniref:hypothetical protein n=1 Tax=Pseudomonas lundensis TaxID=86185 RepID=UPI003F9525F0